MKVRNGRSAWFYRLLVVLVLVVSAAGLAPFHFDVNFNGWHLPEFVFQQNISHAVGPYYWVGGSGNWSDATNHWSTSSGGAGGAGNTPTTTDNVIFDNLSDTGGANFTVTVNATANCANMDWSAVDVAASVLKMDAGYNINVYGNFTGDASLSFTMDYQYFMIFQATSGTKTITTNGALVGQWNFNGVGGTWQLQDAVTMNTSAPYGKSVKLTNGTFDMNNQTITIVSTGGNQYGGRFNLSDGTAARAFTMGTGTINYTGDQIGFFCNNLTGLTLSAANGTVNFINAGTYGAATVYMGGAAATWGNIHVSGRGNTDFEDALVCTNFTFHDGGAYIDAMITPHGNITASGTVTLTGNSTTNRIWVTSDSTSPRTITAATVSADNVDFSYITGAGAGDWDLSAGSTTCFTTCSGITPHWGGSDSDDLYWIGGGNPSTAIWYGGTNGATIMPYWVNWSTASGGGAAPRHTPPASTNNAIFDANSGFTPTYKDVVIKSNVYCKDLNFSAVTQSVDCYSENSSTGADTMGVYGELYLKSGMRFRATTPQQTHIDASTLSFFGTGDFHINGVQIEWNFVVFGAGCSYDFVEATYIKSKVTLNGTLRTNNYAVEVYGLSAASTASLTLGSSTWDSHGASSYTDGWSFNASGTLNAGTSTITTGYTFAGGGLTYYNVILRGSVYAAVTSVTGANTFNNLTVYGDDSLTANIEFSANQQVNGNLTFSGYSNPYRNAIVSSTAGTQRTINVGGTVTATYTDFKDINAGGTWNFAAAVGGIGDLGNNTGITFTPARTVYYVGGIGAQNWSGNHWASTSTGSPNYQYYPVAQDTATFGVGSMVIVGCVITVDEIHLPIIDALNVTNTPTFTATNMYFYNSVKLGAVTWTATDNYYYGNHLNGTLQTTGTMTGNLTLAGGQNSLLKLSGNTTIGGNVTLLSGVFDLNDFNMTASTFVSTTTTANRTLLMGSGDFILTSTATATKWSVNSTNFTLYAETSTIIFTSSLTNTSTFTGGIGLTYNDFQIMGTGNYPTAFTAVNTFRHFIVDRTQAAKSITGNFKQTLTGILWFPEFGTTMITITNTDFESNSGYIEAVDYVAFAGGANTSVATGTSVPFYAGPNSTGSPQTGWSFTDPTGASVTTLAATNEDATEATLNATVGLGQFTYVYLYFDIDLDGTFDDPLTMITTDELIVNAAGDHPIQATGLAQEENYYFRSVVRYNGWQLVYGSTLQFSTTGAPPAGGAVVVTGSATNISSISAIINGELTDIAGYSSVTVWFKYGLTNPPVTTTTPETLNDVGTFDAQLLDLRAGRTYYYQARVMYGSSVESYGDIETFDTVAAIRPTAPAGGDDSRIKIGRGQTYVTRLGPTVAGWLDSAGSLFGTGGVGFGGGLTLLICLVIILGCSRKGYPIAGLSFSLPVQIGSAYVGLWQWAFVGVIIFILALAGVKKMWLDK